MINEEYERKVIRIEILAIQLSSILSFFKLNKSSALLEDYVLPMNLMQYIIFEDVVNNCFVQYYLISFVVYIFLHGVIQLKWLAKVCITLQDA